MPPRRPSKANLKKYDVEAFIERKVALIQMCDTELDILREDPKGSERARRELERRYTCFEGELPDGADHAQAFLKKCERLVELPASTHAERHQKAGAALTLVMHMIRQEADFPDHVRMYILSEYSKRLDELEPCDPSDDELDLLPRDCWPEHIRQRIDAEVCKTVDEHSAETFLDDPGLSIEERTFIIPGDGPDDTMTFRVLGDERSHTNPFWKVFYGDSFMAVKMNSAELKDLLIDSIAYRDY